MKLINSMFLLLFVVSCGNPHLSVKSVGGKFTPPVVTEPVEPEPDPVRVAKINPGIYSSACLVGPQGRYKVRVVVTETAMNTWYVLFRDSICNAPFYKYFIDYSIEKVVYQSPADDENILVDLKLKSYRYVWSHPGYVSRNYCGFTDWVIFAEREISGVNCPALTDRADGIVPAIGDKFFMQMKIRPNENYLGMPFGNDSLGDIEDARYGADGVIYDMNLI